jgi:hypothetical protein
MVVAEGEGATIPARIEGRVVFAQPNASVVVAAEVAASSPFDAGDTI